MNSFKEQILFSRDFLLIKALIVLGVSQQSRRDQQRQDYQVKASTHVHGRSGRDKGGRDEKSKSALREKER